MPGPRILSLRWMSSIIALTVDMVEWYSLVLFLHLLLFRSYFWILFQDQKGFPKELFAVKMYVLTIDLPKRVDGSRKKTQSYKPAVIKS